MKNDITTPFWPQQLALCVTYLYICSIINSWLFFKFQLENHKISRGWLYSLLLLLNAILCWINISSWINWICLSAFFFYLRTIKWSYIARFFLPKNLKYRLPQDDYFFAIYACIYDGSVCIEAPAVCSRRNSNYRLWDRLFYFYVFISFS